MKSNKYIHVIPDFLYDKRIYEYIKDLITYGATSYSSLFETEKDKIVTKIIDVLGSDADQLFFGGDNYDRLLANFSRFLKTADSMDAYDTLNQMRNNAQDQYEYELDMLFEEIKDSNECSRKRESGLSPHIDKINGELSWRKSA